MNKFINKIKQDKVLHILSVLIIASLIVLIIRITYAYLAPRIAKAYGEATITAKSLDDFSLEQGDALSINATSTTLPESGSNLVSTSTSLVKLKANSSTNTATYSYDVSFNISENTLTYTDGSTPEVILTIEKTDEEGNVTEVTAIDGLTYGTFSGVSGFDVTTTTGEYSVVTDTITSSSSSEYATVSWTFTLTYLNLTFDQSPNYGNSMTISTTIGSGTRVEE